VKRYLIAREVEIVNVPDDETAESVLHKHLIDTTGSALVLGPSYRPADDIAWKTVHPTPREQVDERFYPVVIALRAPWSPGEPGQSIPGEE
jgi:hypothetical protein